MTRGTSRALGASVALILIALTAGCTIGAPTAASTPQPTATPNPNAAADAMAVGLRLTLGPTGEWPLEHWSGDVFVFRPTGENATTGTISQAKFDGDTLVLEYFDTHGLGSFTR